MSAPTTLEDLKARIEGPLEVREGPKCAAFVVKSSGHQQTLRYVEFTQDGLRLEGKKLGQLFFSKEDSIKAFWFRLQEDNKTAFWNKVIYWRVTPEATEQDGVWIVYARFCITDCDWPLVVDDPRDAA